VGEQTSLSNGAGHSGRWLNQDRDSGRDASERTALTELLAGIRDRVLDAAQLRPGHRVLDLGAGTGLLTHGAAQRVAPDGRVIAIDQSADALASIANDGALIRTVTGDAGHLPVPSASFDRVVARSVLIYLHDLPAALREIARVLKPTGMLSAFEPVNARRHHDAALTGLTDSELQDIGNLRAHSSPDAAPMMAFDIESFTKAAASAGFDVSIDESVVTDKMTTPDQVDGYLNRRPHPGAANPIELITEQFGAATAARYAAAWHLALHQATPASGITFITPVLYITASIR
jgi:ubiquinone/menaquinone biosynthesis C-methylase UbiE